MLSKNKINKKLKKYIKEHLSKGYAKHAVKNVLVKHGFDEYYVDGLLKQHAELQFVKKYAIIVSLLFIISFFSFSLISKNLPQDATGYATKISSGNEGCCLPICQQTFKNECYGKFVVNAKCNELQDCKVGCCIDKEGYCLTNYLYGNCVNNNLSYINKDCSDMVFCTNITDKSYKSRLHNIKNKKSLGILKINPYSGHYGSSFNIQYYIYDNSNILSISANIKDADEVADAITLYDDGSHNDGVKNDNIYGNNWLSSKLRQFNGFKKVGIGIILKYNDGTQQSINETQNIVVLSNNKCLPITDWGDTNQRRSIIFAANNYDALINGYQKFESDVLNFINVIFSIDKFSNDKEKFNIYRFEQSLSYQNAQTLIRSISTFCPSYSNRKDMVIILDDDEQYCTAESLRVAKVNPQVLFYKNVSNSQINETFANFCSYVITPKKIADEILNFATPPRIIVHTLDSITYNISNINLSFTVSAINYPVNNSVFFDNLILSNIIVSQANTFNISLNLTNGTNVMLIEATDKNDNTAFAQVLLNAIIK